MHIHFYAHSFGCTFIFIHIHFHAHSFSCTFISIHIHFHAHLFSCTFISMHIHFHAHSFSCTFILVHIHFHTHSFSCTCLLCTFIHQNLMHIPPSLTRKECAWIRFCSFMHIQLWGMCMDSMHIHTGMCMNLHILNYVAAHTLQIWVSIVIGIRLHNYLYYISLTHFLWKSSMHIPLWYVHS